MKGKLKEEIIKNHNLSKDEYKLILKILKREPNLLELGIFSVMWSEHCSCKSTKKWLRQLPTQAEWVICGPGENAGIIDIGDNDAIVFKMESHNHPSFIEPYQGAATGVGGILRDIFTMGARPIANINSLRFGDPKNPKTKHLLNGVVSGIGDYGNCVGVPTVGGECFFHKSYNHNILVNAMTVGLVSKQKIFYSSARGIGFPIIYVGGKTGRDGIHGATMASAEFDEKNKDKRPQVQVGDPFKEKLLLEACLELMDSDAIVAIQDMGAAGLTSSSFEMASKGNCGIELELDKVPQRETKMEPYEIMLSETQERMLMIINPNFRKKTAKIFKKWGLEFSEIGKITDSGIMKIFFNGELEAKLPIKPLADAAPEYDRPRIKGKKKKKNISKNYKTLSIEEALMRIMSCPNQSSKEWIFNQYDRSVMGDTVADSQKSDSAIIRIHNTNKAVALTCDCNPLYCNADPYQGALLAVTETWRNLCASGAMPLAITDNLNFGNPEKKEIMYEIVESIKGISEACKKLKYPVVSGNVSLYNETEGKSIYPTPVIGGVGLIKNYKKIGEISLKKNKSIFLIGKTLGHMTQSIYEKEILDVERGIPPQINFEEEIKNGLFIRKLIEKNLLEGCHDVSDGGLIVCLSEMIISSNIGMNIKIPKTTLSAAEWLFSEDQSRYVIVAKNKEEIKYLALTEDVFINELGVAGGIKFRIENYLDVAIKDLIDNNNKWFYDYMS